MSSQGARRINADGSDELAVSAFRAVGELRVARSAARLRRSGPEQRAYFFASRLQLRTQDRARSFAFAAFGGRILRAISS